MLTEIAFKTLTWQEFEQLIAALLEAEGFINVTPAGGSGGDMGLDVSAEELRLSLSGQVSVFRWMIQAKHYAGKPDKPRKAAARNVGHQEIGEVITFLDEHKAKGFLLITDTDLTAPAAKKLTSFHDSDTHQFEAHFWNGQKLADRLRKHPDIVDRFSHSADSRQRQPHAGQNPFKYLESFSASERDLFFGRDREVREIAGIVHNTSICVVFGESGTGKTSLLTAGLLPQLADQRFLTAYSRSLDDPCGNIRRAALQAIKGLATSNELVEIASTSNLDEFLRRIRRFVGAANARMVIALDQFEEAFTRAGEHDRRELADAILAVGTHDTSRGSLTLLFSIREDYLGTLWEWPHRHRLSELWGNAYRIAKLGEESTRLAIEEPLRSVDKSIEEKLVARLIRDFAVIGEGTTYPPYMQIVMASLVDDVQDGVITLSQYEEMSGADTIIGQYLDDRLFTGLSTEYADIARSILDSLTGSEGLRTLLTISEIGAITGIEEDDRIKEIVDSLISRRVVTVRMEND